MVDIPFTDTVRLVSSPYIKKENQQKTLKERIIKGDMHVCSVT